MSRPSEYLNCQIDPDHLHYQGFSSIYYLFFQVNCMMN